MKAITVRPTRRILFLLIGVLVVVLGISGLLCAKQYGQMMQVGTEISGRQAELTKRKGLARDLNSAMVELQKARSKVRHLERRVSEKDYVPTLLGQIEELASSCDLRVVGVEPQEKKEKARIAGPPAEGPPGAGPKGASKPGAAGPGPEAKPGANTANGPAGGKPTVDVNKQKTASAGDKGPYRSQTVDLTVSGTYWNVVKFITKMTEFPKILAVSSVEVEQKKTGAVGVSPVLSVKIVIEAYVLDDKKAKSKTDKTPATQPGAESGKS